MALLLSKTSCNVYTCVRVFENALYPKEPITHLADKCEQSSRNNSRESRNRDVCGNWGNK